MEPGQPVGTLSLILSCRAELALGTSSGRAKHNTPSPVEGDCAERLGGWMDCWEGCIDGGVVSLTGSGNEKSAGD